MKTATMDLRENLKHHFGFNGFKGLQEQVIQSILDGKDTFVIMPTGGGKSLCYQLPAVMSEGTAVVISPLIALMKNQVDLVRSYSNKDDIAHFLNSSLTRPQARKVKEDVVAGHTKLLYVAPETLTKDESIEFLKSIKISFVAVDEAHCISEWGHDFRPEYRRIREMIHGIGEGIPIIALTATATPKVRSDIIKNLKMKKPEQFVASFLRENLYYEIRPKKKKEETIKDIVTFIKKHQGKSGIIYCVNRKTTEELAAVLNVNGVKAAPYHAGLESGVRTKTQDEFLMEDVQVICATIAFGMGIDKPDIRFVIHFTVPKSLENYYQETGRAGRDGLEGNCIAYYYNGDVLKLEKFLRDKPVAEREIGSQHLDEVAAYAESSACRRQFLLHYFGEAYDTSRCGNGECDNCRFPKETVTCQTEVVTALQVILDTGENYGIKHILDVIEGKNTSEVEACGHNKLKGFGQKGTHDRVFWTSVVRHAMLNGYIRKDIEEYGVLKMTKAGEAYLKNPVDVAVPINRDYGAIQADSEPSGGQAVLDPTLLNHLKEMRRKIAKQKNVPPFVVFQDPTLEDMATRYPISTEELANCTGVSRGKAMRYGKAFVEFIARYVEENDIDRAEDIQVKSVAKKSTMKVYIIQNIDRKTPFDEIARAKSISVSELMVEIETIVASGTKVDIDYFINDMLDEDLQEIIYDYFRSAESDSLEAAFEELEDEGVTIEDIQMMRLKFMSEMAN